MELRVEIKKQTKQVRRETIDPGERHFVMTHYTRYLLLNKKSFTITQWWTVGFCEYSRTDKNYRVATLMGHLAHVPIDSLELNKTQELFLRQISKSNVYLIRVNS